MRGRKIYDAVLAVRRERVRSYPRARDFFRHIPMMPGAQQAVAALAERYEIFVTTAAMEYPTSFTAKHEWLREHFPFVADSHIVFCGDKSIISADFLVDDSPHHFNRFIGQGVLFSAPHNQSETLSAHAGLGQRGSLFLGAKQHADRRRRTLRLSLSLALAAPRKGAAGPDCARGRAILAVQRANGIQYLAAGMRGQKTVKKFLANGSPVA